MFHILFTSILISVVFFGYGKLFEKLFGKLFEGIAATMITGILSLTVLWSCLAFFAPLNDKVEILSILLGLASLFYFNSHRQLTKFLRQHLTLLIPSMLLIAFVGAFYPYILDHFGYYVPSIQWLNRFGLTQGLANFELNLAQMSPWHILQAGLSHWADPYLRLNPLLLMIYITYALEKKRWIHFIFVPVLLLFAQSPSPDLPVIVFALIVLDETLHSTKPQNLLPLAILAFTIKPTILWLPLFTFTAAIYDRSLTKKALAGSFFLFSLFVFKNLWLFAYPIFPVQIGGLGLDWTPDKAILHSSSVIAAEKTFDMQYSYDEIKQFTTWEFLYHWLTLKGLKAFFNTGLIVTIALLPLALKPWKNRLFLFLYLTLVLKAVLILLFSAQYRFFIDVFFVAAFVLFYAKISKAQALTSAGIATFVLIVNLAFPQILKQALPSFHLGKYMQGFEWRQFLTPSHFQLNQYETHQIGNLKFNVVKHYPLCFDTPQPAITPYLLHQYHHLGIFPQCSDSRIEQGLVTKKLTPEQKKQLEAILKSYSH
ncbi:LIC_10190 family membrane protein [Bergeyella sp. RCAD1439]|uniref:LIC_10190 family membrane protein n=1 Tax=Bergeyella anatis TaxID=3113737 RepID=UPI002E173690|nr:hypothetical protein [Bergeyella sp. RCAD1439]